MFESFKATRRLKQLEERMETFESALKRIQLEWEDTYDKLRAVVQRIAKRAQRVEALTPEENAEPSTAPDAVGGPHLSPAARAINERILQRRAMNGMRKQ